MISFTIVFDPWSRSATCRGGGGGVGAGGAGVGVTAAGTAGVGTAATAVGAGGVGIEGGEAAALAAVEMTRKSANCQVFCESCAEPPETPTQPPPCGGWPLIVMTCLSLIKALACRPLVTTRSLLPCATPLLIASLSVHPTGVSQRSVTKWLILNEPLPSMHKQ